MLMIILMILDDGSRFTVFQATDATQFEHGNFRLFQAGECDVACQGSQGMQETLKRCRGCITDGCCGAGTASSCASAHCGGPKGAPHWIHQVAPLDPSWSKCSHEQARMTWLEAADVTCSSL